MEDDRLFDQALAGLGHVGQDASDDERWARRVASGISGWTATRPSRAELDELLAAPLPDGHDDLGHDFDHGASGRNDHDGVAAFGAHADAAAHHSAAADLHGHDAPWEGSMSDDTHRTDDSNAAGGLGGLARLARTSTVSNAPGPMDGAAKADDSGLINLKAMTEPEPAPAPPAPAAAPIPTPPPASAPAQAEAKPVEPKKQALSRTVPDAPAARSSAKLAAAAPAPANVAAAPAAAVAPASAAAAVPAAQPTSKKSGAAGWIFGAGIAAAACVAVFVVVTQKSEKAARPNTPVKKEAVVASAPPPAPSASASAPVVAVKDDGAWVAPSGDPAASASVAPDPSASAVAMNDAPRLAKGAGKAGASSPAGGGAAPEDTKPTAPAAAPSADAKKPGGAGSLDEALGLGKEDPKAKVKDAPKSDLPDKPDSMDIRTAITPKVGAASACVKGQDAPSKVVISFGPAGGVTGVSVTSGPAKGSGAEACISKAFSSAKVPASTRGGTGFATLNP